MVNLRRLLAVLAAGVLLAASDPVWVSLRRDYLGLRTLSGSFSETVCSESEGTCQDFSGTFAILVPDHYRLEVTEPVRQTIVCQDSVVWFHFPSERRAVRTPSAASLPLLAFLQPVLDSATAAVVTTDSAGRAVVRIADEELSALSGLTLELDPGRRRITGFSFTDAWGNAYHFRLTNQRWNPKLDPGLFRFVPPRGTAVEEQ